MAQKKGKKRKKKKQKKKRRKVLPQKVKRISLPDPVAWSGSSVYMEK